MDRPKLIDYGTWVKSIIEAGGVTPSALSREAAIPYPSLDRILRSGEKGKPVRPEPDSIEKINQALVRLGVLADENEGWIAAGYMLGGYKVVRVDEAVDVPEPPENFEDWPEELQLAMHYSKQLSPEAQAHTYKLWAIQAKAHAEIAEKLNQLKSEVAEMEKKKSP